MCQDLPLGRLNCLFGMCSAKTETFAVVREFTSFTGTCKNSENFTLYCYVNFLCFTHFSEFLELQKYGQCSDYYRLFCF